MRRWVLVVVAGLVVFMLVGFFLTYLPKYRARQAEQVCANNLRGITLFAAHHANPKPGAPADRLLNEIPAGTISLPGVVPSERLSWYVPALPGFDQRHQNVERLVAAIDATQPWAAGMNQRAARAKLTIALCPGNPPTIQPDEPAPTQYVGIAGLGPDAATLILPPPPATAPARAGCFRYDGPTPFAAITDGLSQSMLIGEVSGDLGPWLRGGPATVRGVDDSAGARPRLGAGGQFGGNHPVVTNFAFADGSVRTFTDRTDPRVFDALATIAGRGSDPVAEE